jgi:putative transposase
MFVGFAIWGVLASLAARVRGLEDGAQAVHALGTCWRVGEGVQGFAVRPKNEYVSIDSTIVRIHQQAAAGKGGIKARLWGVPEAV